MSSAPRQADASLRASDWTAARVGPMQGVQPSPKSAPSSGAPSRPIVGIRWKRHSRLAHGSQPRKASPSRIVSTPRTRVMVRRYS